MNIIIVGQGKLGTTMTKQLVAEGHDVAVIDTRREKVESVVDVYDVLGVCGNGASCEVLEEAGAAKAKLIIATTASDELNILACLTAKRMGTEHTIARVRNPDYANQHQFLQKELGINMIVNPEFETANEISRIIRFPSAAHLDSFAKGKVEIASLRIHSDNPLCDTPVHDLRKKTKAKVIICAVQRDDEVFIPSGDFVIKCDDVISVTGTRSELVSLMRQCGVYRHKIKNILIIGGGRIGFYLAKQLSDTGRKIKLIEHNESKCYSLSENLPDDVTVIFGDGTDQEILDEQRLEYQDALVALTGIDEENIIVSMYAESKGVNKVITKVNRHSFSILNDIGLETIVSPQIVAGNLVTRYVRALHNSADNAQIQTLHKLVNGKVEAAEFIVPENAGYLDIPFKDLNLLPNLLIGCIMRNGKIIFPGGNDVMKAGDSVVVVTANRILEDLHDIFV
ncbi:MAG: Trk system potassium transporter TrkA [Clostridia bacterium]|nr:Trk system potassium transporter TrkA [Clostridia bacterium]